jgi:hypothetical protein
LKYIGVNAFAGCSKLEDAALPASLERIRERAFASCILLKDVNIPETIKSIGEHAFYCCFNSNIDPRYLRF